MKRAEALTRFVLAFPASPFSKARALASGGADGKSLDGSGFAPLVRLCRFRHVDGCQTCLDIFPRGVGGLWHLYSTARSGRGARPRRRADAAAAARRCRRSSPRPRATRTARDPPRPPPRPPRRAREPPLALGRARRGGRRARVDDGRVRRRSGARARGLGEEMGFEARARASGRGPFTALSQTPPSRRKHALAGLPTAAQRRAATFAPKAPASSRRRC